MSSLTTEQQFLLGLASTVWQKRASAKAALLPFNEETITETILLDLALYYPGSAQVVAFNKTQEAATGADWIWTLVNADGSQSMTMLVQAKRLDDHEKVYKGINRKIGQRQPPVLQIDQLMNAAQYLRVPPIYAFYNHVSDQSRVPTYCRSLTHSDPRQILGFGISLAHAAEVMRALPSEKFDNHCNHSIPMHCLLCTGRSNTNPYGGTPVVAAEAVRRLIERLDSDEPAVDGLQEGLHPFVEEALARMPGFAESPDGINVDAPPNVAGIVVLRDAPDERS